MSARGDGASGWPWPGGGARRAPPPPAPSSRAATHQVERAAHRAAAREHKRGAAIGVTRLFQKRGALLQRQLCMSVWGGGWVWDARGGWVWGGGWVRVRVSLRVRM